MKKIILAISGLLLLSSCGLSLTKEEREARAKEARMQMDKAVEERCIELGFNKGSEKMAECKLKLLTEDKAERVYHYPDPFFYHRPFPRYFFY